MAPQGSSLLVRRHGEPKGQNIETERASLTFARVYEEHVWRVYGFLAYRLGDREAAEDLTQATFERALSAWPRYDPRRASVPTWLLAIATNLLVDHHRRDRGALRVELDEDRVGTVAGPEERLAGSPELLGALGHLGEREREVLALRFGADLAAAEIGELLGLSTPNVQQISSRALRRLRTLLEPARPGMAAAGTAPPRR